MPGIRDRHSVPRALHRRSLRFALALPILIPTVALAGLWGYAANGLVEDGLRIRTEAGTASTAGKPAHTLVARLQDERRATAAWQESSTGSTRAALQTARGSTDNAVTDFREAEADLKSAGTAVRDKTDSLDNALGKLSEQRSTINARKLDATQTFRYYTDTTAEATELLATATRMDDGGLARAAAATSSLVNFSEIISREEALLSNAQQDPDGVPEGGASASTRGEFSQYLAVQRQSRSAFEAGDLPGDGPAAYERLTGTPQWDALVQAEDTAAARTTALPREVDTWQDSAGTVGKELRQLSSDSLDGVVEGGTDRANGLLLGAVLGTVLAVVVVAASTVMTLRLSRSLTGRLSRLHLATGEWADTTFPRFVEQLGRDEKPATAAVQKPDGDHDYGTDEVGGLAAAIHRQWQTVVETTLQQARGREGAETVFLGLARRTQVLINRMIPKLDKLEREHEDSRLLKDIFAVDHLATRVRRHTENLLILGGALPGRRWSKAVPIYEVLRSAISETEEYSRVEAMPAPPVSLVGQAVADVGHLLAELIENGTSFSPPETRVCVSAEKVARGLAIEVDDRGLGMPAEQYDELNRMLADPPKPDMMTLGEAPRLGLFVVARLANRHGLEVSLRKSAYGGTLAVVLLPSGLLEETQSLLSGLMPEGLQEQAPDRQDELPAANVTAELPPPPETVGAAVGAGIGSGLISAENGAGSGTGTLSESTVGATPVGTGGAVPQPHLDDLGGYPAYAGAGLLPTAPGGDSFETLGTATLIPGTLSVPGPGMLDTPDLTLTLGSMGLSTVGSDAGPQGAGLLPSTPETDHLVEDAPMSASRPHSPRDHSSQDHFSRDDFSRESFGRTGYGGAGQSDDGFRDSGFGESSFGDGRFGDERYTPPAEPEVPQDRPAQQRTTAGRLPIRVRGENLAEQLRHSSHTPAEASDPWVASPDRAGSTMAAIQSGSKRARATKSGEPAGDSQAETPGYGAGADNSVRKDQ